MSEPRGMIISLQILHIILTHKRTIQDKLIQAQVCTFQTVYSHPLHHQVMVVLCIALRRIFLLSHPLSSHVKQAVVMEEPFTSVMVNVFSMGYVVMIVQVVVLPTFLLTQVFPIPSRVRIISIIHQFHVL